MKTYHFFFLASLIAFSGCSARVTPSNQKAPIPEAISGNGKPPLATTGTTTTAGTNTATTTSTTSPSSPNTGTSVPVVTSLSPLMGMAGNTVVITGKNFTATSRVTINGVNINSYYRDSDTQISLVLPFEATTGPVAVTSPYGTGTSSQTLTVLSSQPQITSFFPQAIYGGSRVTIIGTNFTTIFSYVTAVSFNGVPAAKFEMNSDNTIIADAPAGVSAGRISVTTRAGTTSSAPYTLQNPISSFSIYPIAEFQEHKRTLIGWSALAQAVRYDAFFSLDSNCLQIYAAVNTESLLGGYFDGDAPAGNYYLCVYGYNSAGARTSATNSPLAITLTPRPPPLPPTNFINICTDGDLNAVRNNLSGNYRMVCDIDLGGREWEPIGLGWPQDGTTFSGVFDGNGKKISNFKITRQPQAGTTGFFGSVSGVIQNLTIDNALIDLPDGQGGDNIGVLAGITWGKGSAGDSERQNRRGLIENCTVKNWRIQLALSASHVGGVVGLADRGPIRNVHSFGEMKILKDSGTAFGGVSGAMVLTTLEDASFNGNITFAPSSGFTKVYSLLRSASGAGGVTGGGSGFINNCTFSGEIRFGGLSTNIAGIASSFYGRITNSNSNGTLIGGEQVGGIIGVNNGSQISQCSFSGTAIGTKMVGGIVGASRAALYIQNSRSSAKIYGMSQLGGLVGGFRVSAILNSFAQGKVISFGAPSFESKTGGLLGKASGAANGYQTMPGSITNSYSSALVKGARQTGGLIGEACEYFKTDRTFAIGPVYKDPSTEKVGGLVGEVTKQDFLAINSFWDVNTTLQSQSAAGTPATTSQFANASLFSGWDFSALWNYPTASVLYPTLKPLLFIPEMVPPPIPGTWPDFSQAALEQAFMRGLDFSGARFIESILMGTDFYGASLRGANLSGAIATNSDFRGADLTGAITTNTVFTGSRFNTTTRLPFSQSEAVQRGMIFVQ